MQTARFLLYITYKQFFDQTNIVYFRMKLRFLQNVNKTPCYTKQYVQQGTCPPINIQIFSITCVCLFTSGILFGP